MKSFLIGAAIFTLFHLGVYTWVLANSTADPDTIIYAYLWASNIATWGLVTILYPLTKDDEEY